MPNIHRALFVFFAALLIAHLSSPAAAQASRKTLNQVSQLLLSAYKHLSQENDTEAARADCQKAQAIEAKAKDRFISATVDVCFGDVADYEENTGEACKRYDDALKEFKAVPARHSARRTLKTHMNVTEGKRITLGCES